MVSCTPGKLPFELDNLVAFISLLSLLVQLNWSAALQSCLLQVTKLYFVRTLSERGMRLRLQILRTNKISKKFISQTP